MKASLKASLWFALGIKIAAKRQNLCKNSRTVKQDAAFKSLNEKVVKSKMVHGHEIAAVMLMNINFET